MANITYESYMGLSECLLSVNKSLLKLWTMLEQCLSPEEVPNVLLKQVIHLKSVSLLFYSGESQLTCAEERYYMTLWEGWNNSPQYNGV